MWKSFLLGVCLVYLILVFKYVNRMFPLSSIQTISQFTISSLSERIPLYIQNGKQVISDTQLHTTGRIFYNKKKELSLRRNYADGILIFPETDKVIYLFNPLQSQFLFPIFNFQSICKDWEINSEVNPQSPESHLLSTYSKSEYTTIVIQAGDAFYVPYGWWYFIENDDDTVMCYKWNDVFTIPFKCFHLLYEKII